MVSLAESGQLVNIHSVLVAKDGALVLERYFDGYDRDTLHEIRSATKSVGSMLVGIAIDRGHIASENEPVFAFFEHDYRPSRGWTDQAKKVEIRHLLSMTSGRDCDDLTTGFACEHAMHESDDWVQFSLDLPFAHDPDAHWAYNSSSLILAGEAVARRSGQKLEGFAEKHLFEPLGIKQFHWQHSPKSRAWIGGGARMIPREMAKIGQLMLDRGLWKGERLLSEAWITKSTTKQSEPRTGVDYGFLWQNGQAFIRQQLIEAFWASGNGGQYIIVLPDQGMVVVFTGGNYDSPLASQPFTMLVEQILPAFIHSAPQEEVALAHHERERLVGTFRLDFEPTATSTISLAGEALHLLSPDGEEIQLTAHSPTHFSAQSRYGPLTVVFGEDESGLVVNHTVYGSFQRFLFEREPQ
jgi:CubicO group peptidase (beta-lactamase class C family)